MKVGLALSGGAVRGVAHIGVLEYLETRGIKPHCISGTSAGSIVGALYCAGFSVGEIKDIAINMSWRDLVKISIPRKGLIKTSQLLQLIEAQIGRVKFDQLELPLTVNAVDLLSGEEIVIEDGPVAKAVAASCAIPGIFTPVKYGRRLLVDGGLLNNVPVEHLKHRKLDYLIAVNAGAQMPLQKEPGSIFEILVLSYHIMRLDRESDVCEVADTVIEPDLGDIHFYDTGKSGMLIKRGYDAAQKALEKVDFEKKTGRVFGWFKKRSRKKG